MHKYLNKGVWLLGYVGSLPGQYIKGQGHIIQVPLLLIHCTYTNSKPL